MRKIFFTLILVLFFVGSICAAEAPESLGIRMVWIPGAGFEMSSTEITQRQYQKIMNKNPSCFKGEDYPVECVSWFDAIEFCNELSKKCGLSPAYTITGADVRWNRSADGFRLATVDEWRYAARGGEPYTFAGSNSLDEVGWYNSNSIGRTHPVGQRKANAYGLYDMSGNVWEWCWEKDCGGGWKSGSYSCEVYYPDGKGQLAGLRDNEHGFRIVRNVR